VAVEVSGEDFIVVRKLLEIDHSVVNKKLLVELAKQFLVDEIAVSVLKALWPPAHCINGVAMRCLIDTITA
jgi:hypothetical protein